MKIISVLITSEDDWKTAFTLLLNPACGTLNGHYRTEVLKEMVNKLVTSASVQCIRCAKYDQSASISQSSSWTNYHTLLRKILYQEALSKA